MKTKNSNFKAFNYLILLYFSMFALGYSHAHNETKITQKGSQLPHYLIGDYMGSITTRNVLNKETTCTIQKNRNSSYTLRFKHGASPITNVYFSKNDEVYTSTFLYNRKSMAISVDEDGDLTIGSTNNLSSSFLAFNGQIAITDNGNYSFSHYTTLDTGNNSISVNGDSVTLKNGNQSIHTNGNEMVINTPKATLKTRPSNTSINSRNITISSNKNGATIAGNYYDCYSNDITRLPLNAIGIYRGDLSSYNVDTGKGICKIIETGCKTYRLDFSNGIPSIHGVQFSKINNFKEYTSVVVNGEYSSAIEIDLSYKDLTINDESIAVEFDGEKQ